MAAGFGLIDAALRHVFPGGFTLDLALCAGTGIHILFGPSGAGKSLTLDCLAGFFRPAAGHLRVDGATLFDAAAHAWEAPQRRRCGYVPQDYALFPHLTLRQNLEFAVGRADLRVAGMLDRFSLAALADLYPRQLSGGQRQRGSIARALLREPAYLLLDEPARGLDQPLRQDLYRVLEQVRAEHSIPIVLVTHDVEECLVLGDAMLVIQDGRLVQQGVPAEVCRQPASAAVARLLGLFQIVPGPDGQEWAYATAAIQAQPGSAVRVQKRQPRPLGTRLFFENGLYADVSGDGAAPAWDVVLPAPVQWPVLR